MAGLSERVLRAIAPFGLATPESRAVFAGPPRVTEAAERIAQQLHSAPGVVLVTGPSGAGKSTLLRAVVAACEARGTGVVRADRIRVPSDRPVAALAASERLDSWLGCLSRAGLADARLFATPAGALSMGERARLRLALAFVRIERAKRVRGADAPLLVCDEFCSVLDRETAAGVAASLRRWATDARVVVASAHADMECLLGPDVVVRTGRCDGIGIGAGRGRARGPRVRLERGTLADYAGLARFHYRAARPASVCRVLRAVVAGSGGASRVAGVLVVSHPTLNGAWREMAWPARYVVGVADRVACARRLNREVRRISRVIVDPRDRGRGIASRLVGAYLADPITPATEAVSAMGRLSPFARSAGMVEYAMPPRPADDRLADMLDAVGLAPWELLDAERVGAAREQRAGLLEWELGVWARDVRASVPKAMRDEQSVFSLAPLAAARLCAPPVAYAHAR